MTNIQNRIRGALFIVILLTALSSLGAGPKSIVIHHTDGTSTAVCMVEGISASFTGGQMALKSAIGELSYPLSEVCGWHYSAEDGEVWSGTEAVVAENIIIDLTAGGILLKGLTEASQITVTTTDGRIILSNRACGELSIDGATLPSGLMILTINHNSYKIGLGR